ncbi:hypothetical protein ACFLUR_00570 [Chloroflexota bacterium]
MSKWSKWQDISSAKNLAKELDKSSGVYEIRLSNSAGRPTHIGRLLGIDKKGILAIGESGNLAERTKEFYDAYKGQGFQHCVGVRFFLVWASHYKDWRHSKDNSKVQVRVMKLQNKTEGKEKEADFLSKYFCEYGELPPLINKMPDKCQTKILEHIRADEIIKT